jgi:hypothetical protein
MRSFRLSFRCEWVETFGTLMWLEREVETMLPGRGVWEQADTVNEVMN